MPERAIGRTRVVLSSAFLAIAVGMVALTLARSRERIDRDALPSWAPLLAASALSAVALILWSLSWRRVVGARGHGGVLVHSFLLSQLGKYIPGGVWQAAGQVGFSLRTGMSRRTLGWRLVGSAIALGAGSTFVTALGAAWLPVAAPWRIVIGSVALVGPLVVSPLFPRLLTTVTRRRLAVDQLWADRAILSAVALAAAGFAAYSGGFVVVLRGSTDASVLGAMSAFSLAWLVGFAAVPVPAGLGVREATLVALLAGTTGASTVVAVSVIYRVICILVEVLLAAVTSLGVRRAKRPRELEVASQPRSAMGSIDAARPVRTRD